MGRCVLLRPCYLYSASVPAHSLLLFVPGTSREGDRKAIEPLAGFKMAVRRNEPPVL